MFSYVVLTVLGFTFGLAAAGGVFALISILGVIPRLCSRFGLADHVYPVETFVALGAVSGAVISLFSVSVPFGEAGVVVFGVFSGIFIGALAMALAEALRVIPILCQRLELRSGLPFVILSMALGKMIGTFLQLFLWR